MDILDCDLSTLPKQSPDLPFRLVGNLPYNISTPLIFHLLEQISEIDDMVFMLQREVALRLSANPGNKLYGRLSVMSALGLDSECLFDVPPEAFDPPPKVDSTVIRLRPKTKPSTVVDKALMSRLVTAAFSQRRKTLRNALKNVVTKEQFFTAKIDPSLRAEAIGLEDYIRLTAVMAASQSS